MEITSLYGFAGIPVITGMIQMFKKVVPELPERFWPLVAWILGIIWNISLGLGVGEQLWISTVFGVVVGLAASGFYSQGVTYVARNPNEV